jgi:hypothetical protein
LVVVLNAEDHLGKLRHAVQQARHEVGLGGSPFGERLRLAECQEMLGAVNSTVVWVRCREVTTPPGTSVPGPGGQVRIKAIGDVASSLHKLPGCTGLGLGNASQESRTATLPATTMKASTVRQSQAAAADMVVVEGAMVAVVHLPQRYSSTVAVEPVEPVELLAPE